MFLEKINIENELLKIESKKKSLNWIEKMLDDESHTNQFTSTNKLRIDHLEQNRIYHIASIKSICVDYRLRFVDLKFYKEEIPSSAKDAIKKIEAVHQTHLHSFKILASAEVLHLKNYDDPILFVPIGNDYYYKIYRWGNDLSFFRKIKSYPMKNLGSMFTTLLLVSLITTLFICLFNSEKANTKAFQIITFLFTFKSYVAIVLYYCVWKGRNISTMNWNSHYFNQ